MSLFSKNSSLIILLIRVFLATFLIGATNASANVLTNGSFETGLSPWTFTLGNGVQGVQYQDGSTRIDGNWSEAIQTWSPVTSVPSGARLSQGGIALYGGQVVTVAFAAMASTTRPLSVGIQQTSGAWSWYHFQAFSLTPYWTYYGFSFTMPANDPNTSLNFEMGNMLGDVWIDDVSVTIGVALGDSPDFTYGNPLLDPNLTALTQDSNEMNRNFAFMVGFAAWAENGVPILFSKTQPTMDALNKAGYKIVFTWCAEDAEDTGSIDPLYNYAAILSGQYDAYISQWAHSAAAWGNVFYLRLFHEMNGDWYPWGINVNGNTPALAIQAWQHIYNIFQSAGATNVKFMWCPNVVGPDYPDPLASFYPGDAYVSWLGMDGYNYGLWGEQNWYISPSTFSQVFQGTYNEMISTVSSAKPVMVAETASAPGPGPTDKATWITQMQNDVPTFFPNVQAVAWYDYSDSNMPPNLWQFYADPFSLAAFTALAADSRWQGTLQ